MILLIVLSNPRINPWITEIEYSILNCFNSLPDSVFNSHNRYQKSFFNEVKPFFINTIINAAEIKEMGIKGINNLINWKD